MERSPKILVAVANPEIVSRLEPLMSAVQAEAIHAMDGGALALACRRSFDLVVAQCPLSGLSAARILKCVREPSSQSGDAPIVLLTREAYLPTLERIAPEERVGVYAAVGLTEGLRSIAKVLGLSDRAAVRLMVEYELSVDSNRVQRVCQTDNISTSGMLLHTSRVLPVGSVVPFAIELPEDVKPIHGRAEVVRHASPRRERVPGMGVRFLGLDGDGRQRLGGFLAQRQTPQTA